MRQLRDTLAEAVRFSLGAICAAAILTPAAGQAAATAVPATTTREIQVAGRLLALTSNPLSGDVKMGIVYDPHDAASAQDERALAAILGSGLDVGDVTLIPVPIPIGRIGTSSTDIIFLTPGLGAEAALAGEQAVRKKILCITTDLAATQAGFCAVSLQIDTKVHISINVAALAASDISFTEAFMLMIREI